MILVDLKTQLDQAAAAWSEANSAHIAATTATRALFAEIQQLKQTGHFVKALELETAQLPRHRAEEMEKQAALTEALVRLRSASSEFEAKRQEALNLAGVIGGIEARLRPNGIHARQIAEARRALEMHLGQKAGDETQLAQLRERLDRLTDDPAKLKSYSRHTALTA